METTKRLIVNGSYQENASDKIFSAWVSRDNKKVIQTFAPTVGEAITNAEKIAEALNNYEALQEQMELSKALLQLSLTHMKLWDTDKNINPELRQLIETALNSK